MKARLIKKGEVNDLHEEPKPTTVRTKVSDVIEWVKESRSNNANPASSARARFASLFATPQPNNG